MTPFSTLWTTILLCVLCFSVYGQKEEYTLKTLKNKYAAETELEERFLIAAEILERYHIDLNSDSTLFWSENLVDLYSSIPNPSLKHKYYYYIASNNLFKEQENYDSLKNVLSRLNKLTRGQKNLERYHYLWRKAGYLVQSNQLDSAETFIRYGLGILNELELSQVHKNIYLVRDYLRLAKIYKHRAQYEEALRMLYKVLESAEWKENRVYDYFYANLLRDLADIYLLYQKKDVTENYLHYAKDELTNYVFKEWIELRLALFYLEDHPELTWQYLRGIDDVILIDPDAQKFYYEIFTRYYLQKGKTDSATYYNDLLTRLNEEEPDLHSTSETLKNNITLAYKSDNCERVRQLSKEAEEFLKSGIYSLSDNLSLSREVVRSHSFCDIYENNTFFTETYFTLTDSMDQISVANAIAKWDKYYNTEELKRAREELETNLSKEKQLTQQQRYIIVLGGIFLLFIGTLAYILHVKNSNIRSLNKKIGRQKDQLQVLNRELNHRVKNNLTVLDSILGMQLQGSDDKDALIALKEARSRIRSVAQLYSTLEFDESDRNVILTSYIINVLDQSLSSLTTNKPKEIYNINSSLSKTSYDLALYTGIIINELCTNLVKYGDGHKLQIDLNFSEVTEENVKVEYQDSSNLAPNQENFYNATSLGSKIIKTIIRQTNGSFDIMPSEMGSKIIFKLNAAR